MAVQDLLPIQKPWGLENDVNSLQKPSTPIPIPSYAEKLLGKEVVTPQQPDFAKLIESISENNYKKANSNQDPFESKFQSADLSKQFEGRNVTYGDYKLDPKLLEARYSKTQSYWEQAFNNIQVGAANAASMFLIGMTSLPDVINTIKNGVTGETNEYNQLTNDLFEWNRDFAQRNYNFQNEQDQKTDAWNTIANVLLPSFITGSTTGWGKIFESAGYGLGAIASTALQEIAITAIAPGVGNSAVLALNSARLLNNLDKIRKYGQLADRIIDTSSTLRNVAASLGAANKVRNAARFGYAVTMGAHGEAAFEGLEGEHALKNDLILKFKNDNGYTPQGKDLAEIEQLAKQGGTARYWTNMALLLGTNALQFKRLFNNFDLALEAEEQLAKKGLKFGLDEAGNPITKKAFELKSDWWNNGKFAKVKPLVEKAGAKLTDDFAIESFSEGAEEFTQEWIDKAVNNYYTWKLDHRGQSGIDQALRSISEGFSDSFNLKGLSSFLSGAVAGVGQQSLMSIPGYNKRAKVAAKTEAAIKETLGTYQNFDADIFLKGINVNSVRDTLTGRAEKFNAASVADEVAEGAVENADKKIYKDMESLTFFSAAEPYIMRGHSDILKQQFAHAVNTMDETALQEVMNNNTISKEDAISQFNAKVDAMNKSYSEIKAAVKNPYRYVNGGTNEENAKYWTFETQFFPELAYLHHRTKELNARRQSIQDNLGGIYDDFKFFANVDRLQEGASYIRSKIERASRSKDFMSQLASADPTAREDYNRDRYLEDTYGKALEKLEKFMGKENKTQEDYREFFNLYEDAVLVERDAALLNTDDLLQRISDHDRIVADIDSVQKMLKSYLQPKGEELFFQGFAALSKRENRKREQFMLSEEFKKASEDIQNKYPELTASEVSEVLQESISTEDALKKAEVAHSTKLENEAKIEETKSKVREKFIANERGDMVEDYLNTLSITPTNEKDVLEKVDAYIKNLNDNNWDDFVNDKWNENITRLRAISDQFNDDVVNNTEVLPSLADDQQIAYYESQIQYEQALKEFPDMSSYMKAERDDRIKIFKEAIKEIKNRPTPVASYNEQLSHFDIVLDTDGKYVVSYKNTVERKFDSLQEARDYAEEQIRKAEMLTDVNANINNLENKYESAYYDPEVFDKAGVRKDLSAQAAQARRNKAHFFNQFAENKTEAEISEALTEGIFITKYSTDPNREDATTIYPSNDPNSGALVGKKNYKGERILRSMTADAVVVSYKDETSGLEIPLNTYKDYFNGLAFMNESVLKVELGKKFAKADVDQIVPFISGVTYYEFLKKSLYDPRVFNELNAKGFITFKGSVQEQINLLEEKQKIFNKLNNDSLENIKRDLIFQRHFNTLNYEKDEDQDVNEVMHSFALISETGSSDLVNKRVFFKVANNFQSSKTSDAKVQFIGLSSEFRRNAKKKIQQSFTKRYEKDTVVYSGDYILTTDVNGNPTTYRLKNKEVTNQEFLTEFLANGLTNLAIISDDNSLDVSYSAEENRFNIKDRTDGTKLYIRYEVKTLKNVEGLKNRLFTELGKKNNWFAEDGKAISKVFNTQSLKLKLVRSSDLAPTTVGQMMATRNVTGINRNNFTVSKVIPQWRGGSEPLVSEEEQAPVVEAPSPVPAEVPVSGLTRSIVNRLGFNFPDFVNTDEIDIFVNGVQTNVSKEQLAETIVYAYNQQLIQTDQPFYLNEGVNIAMLDKLATKTPEQISAAFGAESKVKAKVNLFTTRTPYTSSKPSNTEIEERVQLLLKTCIPS